MNQPTLPRHYHLYHLTEKDSSSELKVWHHTWSMNRLEGRSLVPLASLHSEHYLPLFPSTLATSVDINQGSTATLFESLPSCSSSCVVSSQYRTDFQSNVNHSFPLHNVTYCC